MSGGKTAMGKTVFRAALRRSRLGGVRVVRGEHIFRIYHRNVRAVRSFISSFVCTPVRGQMRFDDRNATGCLFDNQGQDLSGQIL